MKKGLLILFMALSLMVIPCCSTKAETQSSTKTSETKTNETKKPEVEKIIEATEVKNWKMAIPLDITDEYLDMLFSNEYDEYKTLYTTTYLNMRPFPNITSNVTKVLKPYTEVTAMSDYNGWTKISVLNENGRYSHFYLWNEYLMDEETKNEKIKAAEEKASEYLGNFRLTAYCNCSKCCGKWAGGATASGTMPSAGRTVAMGGVAFGTKLLINGHVYTVEDRGTPYGHVDIYFNSHSEALQFGSRHADVYKVN